MSIFYEDMVDKSLCHKPLIDKNTIKLEFRDWRYIDRWFLYFGLVFWEYFGR